LGHLQQSRAFDRRFEAVFELNVDHVPDWFFGLARGVVVRAAGVPRRGIGIASPDDAGCSDNREGLGVAVVEQHAITDGNGVAEEIPGLVIADTIPAGGLIRSGGEIVNGERLGLGLEEPVAGGGTRRHIPEREVSVKGEDLRNSFRARKRLAGSGWSAGIGTCCRERSDTKGK
jgi:hypothetical protein